MNKYANVFDFLVSNYTIITNAAIAASLIVIIAGLTIKLAPED